MVLLNKQQLILIIPPKCFQIEDLQHSINMPMSILQSSNRNFYLVTQQMQIYFKGIFYSQLKKNLNLKQDFSLYRYTKRTEHNQHPGGLCWSHIFHPRVHSLIFLITVFHLHFLFNSVIHFISSTRVKWTSTHASHELICSLTLSTIYLSIGNSG